MKLSITLVSLLAITALGVASPSFAALDASPAPMLVGDDSDAATITGKYDVGPNDREDGVVTDAAKAGNGNVQNDGPDPVYIVITKADGSEVVIFVEANDTEPFSFDAGDSVDIVRACDTCSSKGSFSYTMP